MTWYSLGRHQPFLHLQSRRDARRKWEFRGWRGNDARTDLILSFFPHASFPGHLPNFAAERKTHQTCARVLRGNTGFNMPNVMLKGGEEDRQIDRVEQQFSWSRRHDGMGGYGIFLFFFFLMKVDSTRIQRASKISKHRKKRLVFLDAK